MHMSDALLSPVVGGTMWAAAGAVTARSARRLGSEAENRKVPLMGVLAAFVFAGQMVNFTIPGTGASGHIGGGLILAILLGPHAAFISMASILSIQALFFADGGLLALGSNMFNIGFFPAFVAYPLLYRPFAGNPAATGRQTAAAVAAAVIGLQLGALAVVLQTVFSGYTDLAFRSFASVMLPIHLVIGLVEGAVTAAVVAFVVRYRPGIMEETVEHGQPRSFFKGTDKVIAASALTATIALSWFASAKPDGLEWSLVKSSGSKEVQAPQGEAHRTLREVQERTSVLPDYELPRKEKTAGGKADRRVSKTVSGFVGGLLSLLVVAAAGAAVKRRRAA